MKHFKQFKSGFCLLLLFILGISLKVKADHLAAGDLTYKCLGGRQFEFSFTMYRDCGGASGNAGNGIKLSSSCGNVTVNLTEISRTEISNPCPTATTNCNGGSVPGMQAVLFRGTATLPGTCTDWEVKWHNSNRNNAITTIPAGWGGFTGGSIGLTVRDSMYAINCNNSVVFTNQPILYACVGQPFCFNPGAVDPDGDSLYYEFTPPLSIGTGGSPGVINGQVQYNPGYSFTQFVASVTPPTINKATGEVCFTPTNIEVTIFAIRVKEYRNGVLVASESRDLQLRVAACNNNYPTASGIDGTSNYDATVCAGQQLCFTINTDDADAGEIVSMVANVLPPGATFTTAGSPHPVGTFCWTPTTADIRNTPYILSPILKDDHCPIQGVQQITYSILVKNCVNQPLSVTANAVGVCPAACTNITATATGGSSPYTYSWNPGGGTTSVNNVCPAVTTTYTVTVTDNNGTTASTTVTATINPAIVLTTSKTDVSCNGANNGSASVTASGGTAPYTYSWTPSGGASANTNGLAPNTYIVTSTDSKGCTQTASVIITEPSAITGTTSSTNVSCGGGNDGTASVTASDGTDPYTYAWSPSGGAAANASSLIAGTYTVTITDSRGCTKIATAVITEPVPVVLSTSKTDANCGGADGSATVTASGGTGPYTYSWNSAPTQNTATATGLVAGPYIVTVTDSKGCSTTAAANVADIGSPTLTTSKIDVLCNGAATGSISTTVSGGTTPYTYAWSNSANTPNINGLSAGSYTITVTGANGCKAVTIVSITEPAAIVLNTTTINANCGASNGSTTVNVSGGTAPYSYSWSTSPVQNTATANNIPSGVYTITVTDSKGCVKTSSANVNNVGAPTLTTSATDVNCNGFATGTASVTATGGTAPYTYAWNTTPIQTTSTATNLKAGTHEVIVTGANGCITSTSVIISEPSAIVLTSSFTNESCGKSNGTATVSANGGVGPYTYVWSSNPVQSTATATSLPAGTYSAIVYDSKNCSQSISVTITNVPGPLANFNFTNACVNAAVNFTNTSGVNAISWNWSFGDGNISDLDSPSNTYTSPGNYTVKLVVSDAGGCKDSITKVVTVYSLPVVIFGDSAIGCSPLSVTFTNNSTPSSGSTYVWNFGDNTNSASQTPTHLYINNGQNPNSYNVSLTVTSANGCINSLTKNNLVTVYPAPRALFTTDPGITDIMTPTVNFYNQSAGSTITKWTFGDGDSSLVTNPTHTYKDTGVYNVCLSIVNSYGCIDEYCSQVIIKPTWSFYIPNAFTPNGDKSNDTFRGYGENILEYRLLIFDRWGNEIFKSYNLSEAWDGRANGGSEIAQQDVYVYKVALKDVFKREHHYTGIVTLIK